MGKVIPKKVRNNRERLYDWIRKNAHTKRSEGDFISIRIHQIHQKTKVGDEIARVDIPPVEERGEGWERLLALEILETLTAEASELGGLQHYACYSVYSETDDTVNRCAVTIQGEDSDDDDNILSEAPNSTGMVQQAMRHQEANARIMTGTILQLHAAQQRQNDKLMEMNQELLQAQTTMVKDMTAMWEERREMILSTNIENLKAHSMKEGISFFKQIGPVLINQLIGKDLLPVDKRAGVTSMARSLYGSLSEEQLHALSTVLRQDQMIHFITMGETLVADDDEKTNGKDETQ